MDQEEVKYFNVKNTSVRLVHIGGLSILPEQVVPVIDDANGINRADVEASEYLEETDEETAEEKPVAKAPVKKAGKAATATGAGWTSKQ